MRFRASLVSLCLAAACAPPATADVVLLLPEKECREGQQCTFDFGVLTNPASHVFQLINVGTLSSELGAPKISGSNDFRLSKLPPKALSPGALGEFAIDATPTASTPSEATVELPLGSIEAGDQIKLTVSAARPAGAHLIVNGACGFGNVPVGQTSPLCTLTLKNDGGDDLQIDAITVTPSAFQASGFIPVPLTISPGQSFPLQLTATPTAVGPTNGSATFEVSGAITSAPLSVVGT
jgi:hypothetical protein